MPGNESPAEETSDIPIVAVGASAGGIEAIKRLLSGLPENPGYAFVIIQHKSPKSDDSLPDLFARSTDLPVETIDEGTVLKENSVYLNPGHAYVDLRGNSFQLTRKDTEKPLYLPIDHFFESLADSRAERSTGIVLSGTGTDGTLGLKKIKYRGGITIVQEPDTAEYPDMPRNAAQTVEVDFLLSPEEIPDTVSELRDHPYVREPVVHEDKTDFSSELVGKILGLVFEETGHDLRGYKSSPIERRLRRQLAVQQVPTLEDYYQYLRENPDEVTRLFRDLVIDYTQFFRDREFYEILETEVLPEFLPDQSTDRPFRAWVPGCSTGEEAYSLAIVLNEAMKSLDRHFKLKIFATDLNPETLDQAREGFYPNRVAEDIGTDRLRTYFTQTSGGFRVNPSLREAVIFAEHNLLQDPPYTNIDLASCRNLLIYLDEEHQNRALEILHYALGPEGLLCLGPTETMEKKKTLFRPVDRDVNIFRKEDQSKELPHTMLDLTSTRPEPAEPSRRTDSPSPQIIHQAEQHLLHDHGPPAVLLDESHEILHFFGNTDRWLKHPEGDASYNVIDLAREFIKNELLNLLSRISEDDREVTSEKITRDEEDGFKSSKLTVELLRQSKSQPFYYLVIFKNIATDNLEEIAPDQTHDLEGVDEETGEDDLREELASTRSYLRETVERLERKNKELRAKNRELQSLNEEYQSTNEELETSKEELQSTNEELRTVNNKLEEKVESLDAVNSDMRNLFRATQIPVVFLDRDLTIKRFTPAARDVFNLIDSDEGRPLSDITSRLVDTDLSERARSVLETLQHEQFEAHTEDGDVYRTRVIPYRADQDAVEGVVITLHEVTDLRKAEVQARRLEEVLRNANDAIMLLNDEGTIEEWNKGAENLYGYDRDDALGMNVRELVPDARREEHERILEELTTGESGESFRTTRLSSEGERLDVWVTASNIYDEHEDESKVALTERNLDWLPEEPGAS